MTSEIVHVQLKFGWDGVFEGQKLSQRLFLNRLPPPPPAHPANVVLQALESPLGIPALRNALVEGDRVTIVVDRDTPQAAIIIAQLWEVLTEAGVAAEDVSILLPAAFEAGPELDLLSELPAAVAADVRVLKHDPLEAGGCNYLASSVSGERIYLSQHLLDADFVIPIGPLTPDPVLGFRGGVSCLYPGLSDADAIRKAIGQGHEELSGAEVRPQRQLVDEVGWLLGVQFCIGVIPGAGNEFAMLFAGTPDAVLRAGQSAYSDLWTIESPQRCELVLVAVQADAAGHHWDQLGRAAEVARKLVEKDGRILLLSQVRADPGPGLKLMAAHRSAKSALKPLRTAMPPDVQTATRIARAAAWAKVFLLSELPQSTVEDLFLYPIANLEEVQRLLDSDDSTAFIAGAQHVSFE